MNVHVSKAFLSSVSGLKVYLDGNQIACSTERQEGSWLLAFTYNHSAHQVAINFDSAAFDERQIGTALIIGLPIAAIVLFFVVTRIKDRKSKTNPDNSS
ncbi:MAG: hypothetical protein QXU99_08080 [Candidatus Bathyarchaeia archaeon]